MMTGSGGDEYNPNTARLIRESGERVHNMSEFSSKLELDSDWNPIQDAYDQQGYTMPLDDSFAKAALISNSRGSFVVRFYCPDCDFVMKTSVCAKCSSDNSPIVVQK